MKSKFRILPLSSPLTPDFSLTATKKKDVFNVFGEKNDHDYGNFHISRLLQDWTKTQLNYVKKHGTTNFIRVKRRK